MGIPGLKQSDLVADNFHAPKTAPKNPEKSPPMNESAPQVKQVFANLQALQREMEEMAVRSKQPDRTERKEHREIRGPVMVIRGK